MSGSNNPAAAAVDWRPDPEVIAGKIRPVLDRLEVLRLEALAKRSRARMACAAIGMIGGLAALLLLVNGGEALVGVIIVVIASVLIAMLAYHLLHGGAVPGYRNEFKSTAFRKATHLVAPGIDYSPESMVPQDSFQRGGLFNSRIDRYQGEDCFHGRAGETDVLLSELHVQRKDTSTDSKGKSRTIWVTVFRGIYLVANFHKHFNGRVLIEPDIAEARFGWLGRKIQGFSGDLVRLENPDFERAFKIRASDPVEARYLLTPDMQERFLELRNRWSPSIRAALIDSRLHLAIPRSENWFEPDVNSPATNVLPLSDFIQQLVLLLHITEQLDLNTRLWTKQ